MREDSAGDVRSNRVKVTGGVADLSATGTAYLAACFAGLDLGHLTTGDCIG